LKYALCFDVKSAQKCAEFVKICGISICRLYVAEITKQNATNYLTEFGFAENLHDYMRRCAYL